MLQRLDSVLLAAHDPSGLGQRQAGDEAELHDLPLKLGHLAKRLTQRFHVQGSRACSSTLWSPATASASSRGEGAPEVAAEADLMCRARSMMRLWAMRKSQAAKGGPVNLNLVQ